MPLTFAAMLATISANPPRSSQRAMFYRFEHEAAYDAALERLPLYARLKLDLAGIKLTLNQWLGFAREERRVLCHLPVESEEELATFSEYVDFLCRSHHGIPAQTLPPLDPGLWNTPGRVPESVQETSRRCARAVDPSEWARWRPHERYALYKTAVSKNEPEKFFAVLNELRRKNGS
jgi:hypothetical protein